MKLTALLLPLLTLLTHPANADPTWTLSVFAGKPGEQGNLDGKGQQARLHLPADLQLSNDRLYLSDGEPSSKENYAASIRPDSKGLANRIIELDGSVRHGGIGGDKTSAYSAQGNLYQGDHGEIRKADAASAKNIHVAWDKAIAPWLGRGGTDGCSAWLPCFADGNGQSATLFDVKALAIGPDNTLYFSEDGYSRADFHGIRAASADGTVRKIAGGGRRNAPLEGPCADTDWEVAGQRLFLDPPRHLLYLTNENGKGIRQIQLASANRPCQVKLLNPAEWTHGVDMVGLNDRGELYLRQMLLTASGSWAFQFIRFDPQTGHSTTLFTPAIWDQYRPCDHIVVDPKRDVFYASCMYSSVIVKIAAQP